MVDRTIFSQRLHNLRKSKALTQKELGEKLNTIKQSVNNWEKCVSVPSLDIFHELCIELDCSADWLLARTDNPDSHKIASGKDGA